MRTESDRRHIYGSGDTQVFAVSRMLADFTFLIYRQFRLYASMGVIALVSRIGWT